MTLKKRIVTLANNLTEFCYSVNSVSIHICIAETMISKIVCVHSSVSQEEQN